MSAELYRESHGKTGKADKPAFLKFICWRNTDDRISFDCRLLFSVYCDQFFRKKIKPSINRLRRLTGMHHDPIKRHLSRLKEIGVLSASGKPLYSEEFFYPKQNFNPKKWWRTIHGRKKKAVIEGRLQPSWKKYYQPKQAILETPSPQDDWLAELAATERKPTAPRRSPTDKCEVMLAFIGYAKKPISAAYLEKALGLDRRTVRRLIGSLVAHKTVQRDEAGRLTCLVKKDDGSTVTIDHNAHQIVEMKRIIESCKCRDQGQEDQLAKYAANDPARFLKLAEVVPLKDGTRNPYHLMNLLE